MRISSASVYEDAVTNFNNMQSSIARSTNEISSGIALTAPSDNPTAAAHVLVATQGSEVNKQFGVNRGNAGDALNTSDGILSGVTNVMQSLSSQIVLAGNGGLTPADKISVASQLQSSMNQLISLANSTDSSGNYLFSGSAVGTIPYSASSNGAVYNGNQDTQMIQVDNAQQLSVTVVGSSIFGNVQVSPNPYFTTPDGSNQSTATMSSGKVVTPGAVTGDSYALSFTSPTTYDVTDTSTGVKIQSAQPYTSGAPITIDGMQYSVTNGGAPTGTPVAGDQFAIQPGKQNIFQALTLAIAALKQPTLTAGQQANMATSLAQANTSISGSLSNVLNVRNQLGNSLNQISSLDGVGQTIGLSFTTTISGLQDADFAKVASELSLEQATLKAAQEAFSSTSQLSLLNMLR